MNLVRNIWTKDDIKEFHEYEKTLIADEKDCFWEKKICVTSLPCYGRTSAKAKDAAKEIKKGDYISFLDNIDIISHFDMITSIYLINNIKDYELFRCYLNRFSLQFDSWAHVDSVKPKIKDLTLLLKLSDEYLASDKEMVRREGVNLYFTIIKKGYTKEAFKMLDSLRGEEKYYVNMSAAWLLAELFTKYRDETLRYFENNKTNDFIVNKAISKCRDSFRVSKEDKDLLLKFKRK